MLLTVDEAREHVETSLNDEALQLLLDAAESAIIDVAGAPTGLVETHDGGGTFIFLTRRAESVTSISESWYTTTRALDPLDYRLRSDGVSLERLFTGTYPSDGWAGTVTVTYEPWDDDAERKRVQIELLRLEVGYRPGVTSETIGSWSEQYASSAAWNYTQERAAILASLRTSALGFA